MAVVQLTNITKRYPGPSGGEGQLVLAGVNLSVGAGESVAVVGPSGCGKSTLLNIIGTLEPPTGGTVLLDGVDVSRMAEGELAAVRSRSIGFVFQLHHLLGQCSVIENVMVPTLALPRQLRPPALPRATELLGRVGLGDKLDHRPGELSVGQCQRVAVVRALINSPHLLLADEPTGSLDRAGSESLAELLAELNRTLGLAMVVVTHSTAVAAKMKRVLELRDGLVADITKQ